MRLLHAGLAAVALAAATAALAVGGRSLAPPRSVTLAPASAQAPNDPARSTTSSVAKTTAIPRPVAPHAVVPPVDRAALERAEPRAPLSELALARPPKPLPPNEEWQGRLLPRPTAAAAGILEAKGFQVTLAGIELPLPQQTCSYQGRDWACGRHARTAFRAFLRGRSVICDLPDDVSPGKIQARCRIGKQDLAAWLISNGWARATPDSPLAELGSKAEKGRKGLFGPPPASVEELPRELRGSP